MRLRLVFAICLLFLACPGPLQPADAGAGADAGAPELDAGAPDAGLRDAGTMDAGSDAGATSFDAGSVDAGGSDGGVCAFTIAASPALGLRSGWAQPVCGAGWCWVYPLPFGSRIRTLSASGRDDAWLTTERGVVAHFDGVRWQEWRPSERYGAVASAGPGHAWLTQAGVLVEFRDGGVTRFDAGVDNPFVSAVWAQGEEAVAIVRGNDPQNNGTALRLERDGGVFVALRSADLVAGRSLDALWTAQHSSIGHFVSGQYIAEMSGGAPVAGVGIASLAVDSPTRVAWAGPEGLFEWNGTRFLQEPSVGPATSVSRAPTGAFFAASTDLLRQPRGGSWQHFTAPRGLQLVCAVDDDWAWGTSGESTLLRYASGVVETPASFEPNDITAAWFSADDDGWATVLGSDLLHWEGHDWSRVGLCVSAQPTLVGVHGTARDDVWAAATTTLLHFDGGAWSEVALPATDGGVAYIGQVAALSRSDVWVVNGGTLLHFDGATWRAVSPGFGVGGARLLASATGLLAVTSTEGLWRLNGGAWAQVSLPFSARIGSASVSRDGTLWLINLAGEVWTGSPAALVAVDAGVPIPDVNFARVFALGPGEAILQTAGVQFSLADGGVSPLSLPMNPSVSAVVRTGAATWVFAENGGVLRSP